MDELFVKIEALIHTSCVPATQAAQGTKIALPIGFGKAAIKILINAAVSATATGLVRVPAMMQIGNGAAGEDSKETPENEYQNEPTKTEPKQSGEVTPTIKQVYNSLKNSPQYPEDFRLVQNGTKKLSIKNKQLLEELRKIESGEWNKIYKDGYSGGDRVSIHYFQSKSGKVFNVKVKLGWSNQE